jgi:lipid-binding SYLF domain-containing protein
MKMKIGYISTVVCSAFLLAATVRAQDELQVESQQAVANFLKTDPTIQKFFDESAGYAVFPDVGKGGFVVGGARGKGLTRAALSTGGRAKSKFLSV